MSDTAATAAVVSRRRLSLVPPLVESPTPPVPPVASVPVVSVDRDDAIAAIRAGLRRRSGKAWSVRGGRGTSWGWITITAPPRRQDPEGCMTDEDRVELAELLGLGPAEGRAHWQGVTVPASAQHRHEYIARAEGREPEVIGVPYWD